MKICPNCSTEYEDMAKFCRNDGGALQPKSAGNRCPKCGGDTQEGKKFCHHCGASLDAEKNTASIAIETPEARQVSNPNEGKSKPVNIATPQQETIIETIEPPLIQRDEISRQNVSIPQGTVERVPQIPPKTVSSSEAMDAATIKPPPRTVKRTSRVLITLAILLGVAVVLGAGLVYYAQTRGESVTSLVGKWFAGEEQTQQDVGAPANTGIAQVLSATELGFGVSGPGAGDVNRSESLISEKIESQLDKLRNLYQQQMQQKPGLMGSLTLQLSLSPSGQVTKIEELAAQLNDADFKKSVVDEAYKWRFPEASSGVVVVNYPLLFVPPGMDAATLLKREQSIAPKVAEEVETPHNLTPPEEEKGSTRQLVEPAVKAPTFSEPKTPPVASAPAPKPKQQPALTPPPPEPSQTVSTVPYETLMETFVYREPREGSPRVALIAAGTIVNVAAVQGEWLEVRSKRGNPPGFIKRESATPLGKR